VSHIEPDTKITDLVGRLTDDMRRLVSSEVQLAKLEIKESIHSGSRGVLWLALAFGVGIVAMVAATIFVTALIGRLTGNLWVGALATGALELGVGAWLVTRGGHSFTRPSYTLDESREELRNTGAWIAKQRRS